MQFRKFAHENSKRHFNTHTMTVNLRTVIKDHQPLIMHLDDEFFLHLDQDEIKGGDVQVELRVKEGAGDCFHFNYTMKGTARVLCDRCLDEVSLAVDLKDTIDVAHGDENDDNGDIIIIPFSQQTYDIDWDMYELISLHFPIQHVHPDGGCNADMLSRFSTEEDSENDDDF